LLSCREIAERANDYVDGNLGFWPAMQVRMHLLACRSCRNFVGQMRAVVGLLWRYGSSPPAGEPKQELLDAFRRNAGATSKQAGSKGERP
jgi:predicted anti-sigma-YlaC factor YlaD